MEENVIVSAQPRGLTNIGPAANVTVKQNILLSKPPGCTVSWYTSVKLTNLVET